MLKYLSQYDYIFESKQEKSCNIYDINYIWQCWLQGTESAPSIVKSCLKSVEHYHANLKIKILDLNNVQEYIQIPKHIFLKFQQGIIGQAHFSDYIRVALLAKYGGTWIDSTVLLTDAIPNEILAQDFFAYKFPPWCKLSNIPQLDYIFSTQTRNIDKRCFSNWFMHAKQSNRLIMLIKLFLEEYWSRENTAFDYYMFHLYTTYAILKDYECNRIFFNMHEISNAYPHLLQQCLSKPHDADLFNKIRHLTNIHKLTYKLPSSLPKDSFLCHINTLF